MKSVDPVETRPAEPVELQDEQLDKAQGGEIKNVMISSLREDYIEDTCPTETWSLSIRK